MVDQTIHGVRTPPTNIPGVHHPVEYHIDFIGTFLGFLKPSRAHGSFFSAERHLGFGAKCHWEFMGNNRFKQTVESREITHNADP